MEVHLFKEQFNVLKASFSQILTNVDDLKREFGNKLNFNKNEIQNLSLKLSFDESVPHQPLMASP